MRTSNRSGVLSVMKMSLLASVAFASVTPAFAQVESDPQLPTPTSQAEGQDEGIVVTGSLLARSGFDAPTPVTAITAVDLERVAASDISDVVNQIPAVRTSLTNSSTGNSSYLAAGSYTDLRGLGFQRTLVLVDGRRYAPTIDGGALNTSALPQALIRGVDVVTGGASAAYGSDAVAGVVNYLMDDKFEGFKGKVQGGITDHNDYRNYLASLAFGASFLGGRARLTVAVESAQNNGIKFLRDRSWSNNVARINNPAYTATNNEPRQILASDVRFSNATHGGLITSSGPLSGIQFLPDGTAVPFTFGTLVTATTMVGGDGVERTDLVVGTVPMDRHSLFGRLSVDATDSLTFFVEGNYALVKSSFLNTTSNETLTISRDNPFIPQSVRNVMVAQNIPSFVMGRSINDNRRETRRLDVESTRVIAGVKGRLGELWNWDAYYSGGWTDNQSIRANARLTGRFALALDAVINPATGAIVCRSTLTNPTNGCVPINLIGEGRASQAALNYTNTDGVHVQDIEQHVIAGKVRGEPFSTWAGPVGIAIGAEYRSLSVALRADPLSAAYAFTSGGISPYKGKVNVKEAFGELLIPLARDEAWAKNLSLNFAGRVTNYSTSGTVYTWKAGLNYAISDSIRFRATRSRDIRAPSADELFSAGSSASLTVLDPLLGKTYSTLSRNMGNPNLKPEVADTVTVGIIISPKFISGFSMSVDYYNIRLKDAIIALSPSVIVAQCYSGSPNVCSSIYRGADNHIDYVINGPANFQRLSTQGIDFEASYKMSLGSGEIDLRSLATYIIKANIQDPTSSTDLADSVDQLAVAGLGGSPNWRVTSRLTYSNRGRWISVAARYVGGGRINPSFTYKDLDVLRVDGRLYVDVSAEHPLFKDKGDSVALFGSVSNLLDNAPPLTGTGNFVTSRALYDTIGRVYNMGVKFRF